MRAGWLPGAAGLLLLLACGGCGDAPAPPARAGRAAGPAARPLDATLSYWNGLNSLPGQMAPNLKGGPAEQVRAFREAAGVIRGVPTLGSDPELTDWAQRMATLLDRRADLIESARDPAVLAEAFLRGVRGDPFGVGIELSQAERSWVTDFRAVSREQHRLRARLTARYGVEFPNP